VDGIKGAHAFYGIVDELGELNTAINNHDMVNIREEIGDFFWYLALACTAGRFSMDALANKTVELELIDDPQISIDHLLTQVACYASACKNIIFYNKAKPTMEPLAALIQLLMGLCDHYGFGVQEILDENQDKLQKRYPEKFSEEDAVERKDKEDV